MNAEHQLAFGENLPVPVLADPRSSADPCDGEARESNTADKPTVQHRNQSRAGQCPPTPRGGQNLSDIRDLQDKLGAEAAGLVWALKQLDRYLK